MAFLKYNSKYIGIDPNQPNIVYANRDKGLQWEEMVITKNPSTPWYNITATAVNKPIRLNEHTKQLETGTDYEGWGGQWIVELVNNQWIARVENVVLIVENYIVSQPVPNLTIVGNDFFSDGKRTSLAGTDMFLAYRQWLNGGAAALAPFIAEAKELGWKVWRVFLAGDASQNQVLTLWPQKEPNFYNQLKPFVKYLNENGIIPLLTVNIDMQVVMPNQGERVNNWNRVDSELKGSGLSYLLSGGNQADKNGFDPYEIPNPGPGVWWARGSKTEDKFYEPRGATAAEFHPVRNLEEGRTQMDAVASVFYMQSHGCGMLWMTESFPFDDNTPVHYGYDLGRLYATYWALAIFHNRQNQRGLTLKPGTKECAKAFLKGMKLD